MDYEVKWLADPTVDSAPRKLQSRPSPSDGGGDRPPPPDGEGGDQPPPPNGEGGDRPPPPDGEGGSSGPGSKDLLEGQSTDKNVSLIDFCSPDGQYCDAWKNL